VVRACAAVKAWKGRDDKDCAVDWQA